MKFLLSIGLLATLGAALPSVTRSDAAVLNPRADPIPCSSGGTCVAVQICRATENGQVNEFRDLSCSDFGKPPGERTPPPKRTRPPGNFLP
ncbi:hypothetical protein MCOR27_004716 [Pyricularia oryzae]|uniref:Uncharacterized protein n=1 Tax=Pyricularia grisea TaxID=148305 RepID=A0ABQ8NSG3_PYRGI|nr:hypothetical protein MCOR01_002316 [Pyricularia oryzae]KAI6301431.1 hypothetical protein MCOR33_003106 [Pyricularia grisea]KAI6261318.1 hypothetical protein MCOR19_002353 [Pyricularia oryzae]KAI6280296.1 hypothetical protein MCOR27_004716 [Pyricularia oryzae]KAI6329186.1 hypothetical protein MCOR29_002312 [Pyricularia oryzae]